MGEFDKYAPVDEFAKYAPGEQEAVKVPSDVGYGESFARGAAQAGSFGFADELTGAIEGFSDYMTSPGDLSDKYREKRDESRAAYREAEQANPKMSLAGNLAGGLASAFVPGGVAAKGAAFAGKGMMRAGLMAAGEGGLYGLGGSEADLTQGEYGQAAKDVGSGALVGGAFGAALQPLTKLGGASVARLAAKKQRAKASANFVKVLNKTGKWGDDLKAAGHKISDVGDLLADTEIIGLSANPAKMLKKADDVIEGVNKQMNDLADEAALRGVNGIPVSQLEDELLRVKNSFGKAGTKSHGTTETSMVDRVFNSMAEDLEQYKVTPQGYVNDAIISLKELRAYRSRFSKKIQGWGKEIGTPAVMKDARRAITDVMENLYGKAKLLREFKDVNKKASMLKMIRDGLERKDFTDQLKGSILPDLMTGTAGSLISGMMAGAPGVLTFGAGILAAGAIKKHGIRLLAAGQKTRASLFSKLSKNITKMPRAQQEILKVAAQRGPNAIVAAHFMLSQQSPEYRKKMADK